MKKLLTIALLGIAALSSSAARASTTCQPTAEGQLCISQVDFTEFAQQAYMTQYQSQWCWAASISMVFEYYGHPVSQSRIVTSVYGAPENIPAQAGIVIAQELNRGWTDDNGVPFTSTLTGVFDAMAGVGTLTNQQIINELDQGHPMVLAAKTHAMVLTAIQYYVTPAGPSVVAAGVFDPWPGIGPRGLDPTELVAAPAGGTLIFLATVRVTDGAEPPPHPQPKGTDVVDSGGCSVRPGLPGGTSPLVSAALIAGAACARMRRRRSPVRMIRRKRVGRGER